MIPRSYVYVTGVGLILIYLVIYSKLLTSDKSSDVQYDRAKLRAKVDELTAMINLRLAEEKGIMDSIQKEWETVKQMKLQLRNQLSDADRVKREQAAQQHVNNHGGNANNGNDAVEPGLGHKDENGNHKLKDVIVELPDEVKVVKTGDAAGQPPVENIDQPGPGDRQELKGVHAANPGQFKGLGQVIVPGGQEGVGGGEVMVDEGDPGKRGVIPVLVMACNRQTVNQNLDDIFKYRPSAEKFPVIVSQDCGDARTASVIASYGDRLTHIKHPDLSDIPLTNAKDKKFKGYYKIARHYKWALNQVFKKYGYETVIIVEDDINLAPDFFEYFEALLPILRADPTLWCVSAWNDNGIEKFVEDNPELLYRTDFFPGLGWMLERKTWLELEPTWPVSFWDDWMRLPGQRKGRACIRPEVSRTTTFGKKGVSLGMFYEKYLKYIKRNTKPIEFTKRDMTYLMKETYDRDFVQKVYSSPIHPATAVLSGRIPAHHTAIRVQYSDRNSFKGIAKALGFMDDYKSGVPRAAYRGVVSLFIGGRRVFIAPPPTWTEYDEKWP